MIESPDRTPQELKDDEDWVLERQYKQVPGVADDSGFGGTVMQYQVLLDPARLYAYHMTVPTVMQQLSVNNSNAGGGFYEQGDSSITSPAWAWCATRRTLATSWWARKTAVPTRIGDIGQVDDRERAAAGRVRLQQDG